MFVIPSKEEAQPQATLANDLKASSQFTLANSTKTASLEKKDVTPAEKHQSPTDMRAQIQSIVASI